MNTSIEFTPNLHVITVKYLGATNHRPARYKLVSDRFKQSISKSYRSEHSFNYYIEYAIAELKEMGFNVIGKAEGKGQDFVITDTFKPLSPIKD